MVVVVVFCFFFFQAEDGIRDYKVTGVQTCALPISLTPWQMAWGKLLGAPLPAWLYMLWCALAVLATSTGQPGGLAWGVHAVLQAVLWGLALQAWSMHSVLMGWGPKEQPARRIRFVLVPLLFVMVLPGPILGRLTEQLGREEGRPVLWWSVPLHGRGAIYLFGAIADLQRLAALLAAAAHAIDADAARVGGSARQRVLVLQVEQHEAATALGHVLEAGDLEGEDAATRGSADHMRGWQQQARALLSFLRLGACAHGNAVGRGRGAQRLAVGQRDEGLARLLARDHVAHHGHEAVATRPRHHPRPQSRRGAPGTEVAPGPRDGRRGTGAAREPPAR